jgi:S-(hydroxymethyl)glutathione dehydrogenase/alcohol dehydrogenase
VIQGARIAGAAQIIAIDPVAGKRESALALGATHAIDPTVDDAHTAVRDLTGGRGADYAFEVIGIESTLQDAFRYTRRGGATIAVGVHQMGSNVAIPSWTLVAEERRLLGCWYGGAQVRRELPRMIEFATDGRLDLKAMVSRTVHLDDVNEAFRAMQAGEVIRTVIV